MKRIIIISLSILISMSISAQDPNIPPPPPPPPPGFEFVQTKKIELPDIKNENIHFELDSSNWYIQNPEDVIEFMESMGQVSKMNPENIVGLFTYNKQPVINYPSIMILNTKTKSDPPPMDQLEKEFGAILFSFDDFDSKTEIDLSEYIKEFEFDKPIFIKEKNQLIMETTAKIPNDLILKVRQSLFFKKRNIVAVQISYIENRDEKHLDDFNRIIETIKFGIE